MERVDRIIGQAKALRAVVNDTVRERINNQIDLWEACKQQVAASREGSVYQPIY